MLSTISFRGLESLEFGNLTVGPLYPMERRVWGFLQIAKTLPMTNVSNYYDNPRALAA